MASLQEIQNHLSIELGDKKLRDGRKKPNKNRYYRYDDYYIVELTQDKWMVCSNSNTVRRLLRLHYWFCHLGYANTNTDDTIKTFHRLYMQYEDGLVCDHIDRNKFNNRFENLRIVTCRDNNRNRTKPSNNTSGYTGINNRLVKGHPYFTARITDNSNKELSKSFNIDKLGRTEALRQAIAQRLQWTQQFGYDHQ